MRATPPFAATVLAELALAAATAGAAPIAAGGDHSLFLTADGTLLAAGDNFTAQLGDGSRADRSSPVTPLLTGVQSVAAGRSHSLFLKTDGQLWAVGWNHRGELGLGHLNPVHTPARVGSSLYSAIAAGDGHSLAVRTDGALVAMGDNRFGQLGKINADNRRDYVPVKAPLVILASGALEVAAGARHSLLLKTDHTLWTTGDNRHGQLGTGDTADRAAPVQIASGVAAASAGAWHTVFLKTDGTLWAFGCNDHGQLGTGDTADRTVPVKIASGVAAVSAGDAHTIFRLETGAVLATGGNYRGQLGDALAPANRLRPVQINPTYVLALDAAMGLIQVTPAKPAYLLGDVVSLVAYPEAGYAVTGWTGVDTAHGDTAMLTIDGDRSVTAHFTSLASYAGWSAQLEDPAQRDPAMAPLGDGISNLLKFALGAAGPRERRAEWNLLLPPSGAGATSLAFRRFASRTGLSYDLERSADLAIWEPLLHAEAGQPPVAMIGGLGVDESSPDADGSTLVTVQLPLEGDPQQRIFLRLRLTISP